MIDHYGRKITYLRLSVTELCNLRCRYCMPADGICKKAHADMLTEDGTIYHVQSFFVGNVEMCDLLDALTIEAIERVK